MPSLSLLDRPTTSETHLMNLSFAAEKWQRTSRARGGYWLGSFMLASETLTRSELVGFYESSLGCIVQERAAGGILSWEGFVQEMRLLLGDTEYMISLRPEWWHNNVKVLYRSIVNGSRQTVDWSERTDSSDEYGEMQMLLSLPATTTAAATALQAAHLNDYGWPHSRMIGGLAFPRATSLQPDQLYVKCAGFWHSMNWLYQETSVSDTAANLISTLAGNSEFVTAGRIEANTLSTYVECEPNPLRIGAAIADVAAQGDASGNLWQAGVYGGKSLVYEQAPATVEFYLRPDGLYDKSGALVHPELLEPGFLLYNSAAPANFARPGTGSVWDDPQVAYVEQVEFVAPDGLRLRLYDEEETIAILGEQIRAEVAMQPGKNPRWRR